MKTSTKLMFTVAAACGLFATGSAQAFDFGWSSHHHHSAGQCYDRTVAWAQSVLKSLGYYCGCVDGIAGSQTRRALIRYQCDHGLPHTGWLDSRTICMLRGE